MKSIDTLYKKVPELLKWGGYVVRRTVIILVLLLAMSSMAKASDSRAMRNQPLGWLGWAWDTPLQEIKGWLTYAGYLNLPYIGEKESYLPEHSFKVFTRQNESNIYFGLKEPWNGTYYIFEDSALVGVLLFTYNDYYAATALGYFGWDLLKAGEEYVHNFASFREGILAEKSLPEREGTYFYSLATGTYSSFLLYFGPGERSTYDSWDGPSYIFIGKPDWWIFSMYQE